VVSGIVGDIWCGKVNGGRYLNAGSVLYSHGISTYGWMIDAREWKISEQAEEELDKFFKNRITSNETFLLELVRAKITLLSFLCYSFERRGIRCSAPFLDKHVVEAVLSLNPKLRLNRKWQNEYFTNLGISDAHLPRTLLKINRLAVKEGAKKQFNSYEQLKLPTPKLLLLKILLSKPFRKAELALTQHKVTEYALRKLRYRRSDVLISILNVLTK
jgi:asparagine synthetase B (glutamine-hydrolysing)